MLPIVLFCFLWVNFLKHLLASSDPFVTNQLSPLRSSDFCLYYRNCLYLWDMAVCLRGGGELLFLYWFLSVCQSCLFVTKMQDADVWLRHTTSIVTFIHITSHILKRDMYICGLMCMHCVYVWMYNNETDSKSNGKL